MCARYLIENSTLLGYSGDSSGTQWQWAPIAYTPPTISGKTYSWTVQATQVNGADTDIQMNGDGFGPATYVRAGEQDNRNGISPAVTFAAVAAVGIIAARIFGIPAALDAAVTAGEYSLSGLLSPSESDTVKNAFDAEGAQAGSAQIEVFAAFLNLDNEEGISGVGGHTIKDHVGKTNF